MALFALGRAVVDARPGLGRAGAAGAWLGRQGLPMGAPAAPARHWLSTSSTRAPPRRTATTLLAAAATGLAGFAVGGLAGGSLAPAASPARAQGSAEEEPSPSPSPSRSLADAAPWVRELASGAGVVQILSAAELEQQAHAFLRADHVVRVNARGRGEGEEGLRVRVGAAALTSSSTPACVVWGERGWRPARSLSRQAMPYSPVRAPLMPPTRSRDPPPVTPPPPPPLIPPPPPSPPVFGDAPPRPGPRPGRPVRPHPPPHELCHPAGRTGK